MANKILAQVLAQLGLTYYLTSVVKCRPAGGTKPSATERKACADYLKSEVVAFTGDFIVPMGKLACQALGISQPLDDVVGTVIPVEIFGKRLNAYPVWSPGNILARQALATTWQSHWEALGSLVLGRTGQMAPDITLGSSVDPGALYAKLGGFPAALDLETTSLDPTRGNILTCAVYSTDWGAAWPISSPALARVTGSLPVKVSRLYAHNTAFEAKWYKYLFGRDFLRESVPVLDTMLLAKRVDPTKPGNLAAVSARFLPEYAGYKADTAGGIKTAYSVPEDKLLYRNGMDAKVTYLTAGKILAHLEARDGDRFNIEDLEEDARLAIVVNRIQDRGMLLDEEGMVRMRLETESKQVELTRTLRADCRDPSFNPLSSQQVGEILQKFDVPLDRTEKGNIETGEITLRNLGEKYPKIQPFVSTVLEVRGCQKLLGTYLTGYATRRSGDGRIRSDLTWPGTATWRLASGNPNLQNVPRIVRHLFVARPGYVLIEGDYSQAELRIAAALSGEPVLCDVFRAGGDPHTMLAQRIFCKREVTKDERHRAKTTNFGLLYGAGPHTLQAQFAKDGIFVTIDEARTYHRTFWGTYSALSQYVGKKMDEIRAGGRVYAPTAGYSWTMEDFLLVHGDDPEGAARSAFNATIQSVPPRWTLRTALICEQEGMDVILQTHDGLILEVPEKEAIYCGQRLREIMSDTSQESWTNGLPVPADVKMGPNWGEMADLSH